MTCPKRARGAVEHACWEGLMICGKQASAVLTNVRIEGAYRNAIVEASPLIRSCEFAGNHYALYCMKKSAPQIESCRFHRNVYGVSVETSSPVLAGNTITENNVGVYVVLSTDFVAGKNIIERNGNDYRAEQSLGPAKAIYPLQQLWEVMREVY
jgi:parallel beta-helix repeat protein